MPSAPLKSLLPRKGSDLPMNANQWMDLTVLERKKYNYLCEVLDLTQQLGQSLDRNDPVSLKILVAMRQDPIQALEELNHSIQQRKTEFSSVEQQRISELLSGAPPADGPETAFSNQANLARRQLERVLELDRRINIRLAGENSFYKQ